MLFIVFLFEFYYDESCLPTILRDTLTDKVTRGEIEYEKDRLSFRTHLMLFCCCGLFLLFNFFVFNFVI